MPELPTDTAPITFHPRSELFTVRLWQEDLGDGCVEWRGKVQHVLSGQVHYFRSWSGLIGYLVKMLPALENHAVAEMTPLNRTLPK